MVLIPAAPSRLAPPPTSRSDLNYYDNSYIDIGLSIYWRGRLWGPRLDRPERVHVQVACHFAYSIPSPIYTFYITTVWIPYYPYCHTLAYSPRACRDLPVVSAARKELCEQSTDLLMKEWLFNRHVHENYNSTTAKLQSFLSTEPSYKHTTPTPV
jgi:hypothetical protein